MKAPHQIQEWDNWTGAGANPTVSVDTNRLTAYQYDALNHIVYEAVDDVAPASGGGTSVTVQATLYHYEKEKKKRS